MLFYWKALLLLVLMTLSISSYTDAYSLGISIRDFVEDNANTIDADIYNNELQSVMQNYVIDDILTETLEHWDLVAYATSGQNRNKDLDRLKRIILDTNTSSGTAMGKFAHTSLEKNRERFVNDIWITVVTSWNEVHITEPTGIMTKDYIDLHIKRSSDSLQGTFDLRRNCLPSERQHVSHIVNCPYKEVYDYPFIAIQPRFTKEFVDNYMYEDSKSYYFALHISEVIDWSEVAIGYYNVFRNENNWVSNRRKENMDGAVPAVRIERYNRDIWFGGPQDHRRGVPIMTPIRVSKPGGEYGYYYYQLRPDRNYVFRLSPVREMKWNELWELRFHGEYNPSGDLYLFTQ